MASDDEQTEEVVETSNAVFEFEPDKNELLEYLVPRNFLTQIYRSVLESSASEHAARMTSMDNATRNAGDMIDRLTLTYNRTRQAFITKELIEIISGAEAV
jgi:F-type H+-transporting ATPase subunit gamma